MIMAKNLAVMNRLPIHYPHYATLLALTTPGSEDSMSPPTAGLDSTYLKKRIS